MTATGRKGIGTTALLAALTAASVASAEPARPRDVAVPDFAATSAAADPSSLSQPWSAPSPHKTLQLDSKGRWGVRLDMAQPPGRATEWKDVEAGAYLKLTPRIRVGGSVGFGDKFASPQRLTPQDAAAPRVHLETAFKF